MGEMINIDQNNARGEGQGIRNRNNSEKHSQLLFPVEHGSDLGWGSSMAPTFTVGNLLKRAGLQRSVSSLAQKHSLQRDTD